MKMRMIRSWLRGRWYLVLLACFVMAAAAYVFRSKWLLRRAVSYRKTKLKAIVKQAARSQTEFQKELTKHMGEKLKAEKELDAQIEIIDEAHDEREKAIESSDYADLERMFHTVGY